MNTNSLMAQDLPDTGFFQATVTSSKDASPISGATVCIRTPDYPNEILEETTTDASGKTEAIPLPAPPVEYSLSPGSKQPYSNYSIVISAPEFETIEISGAEILSGQKALQNTALLPQDVTQQNSEELFVISPHTLYEEYPPKIPEDELKSLQETGEIVLSRVVIPSGVRKAGLFSISLVPYNPSTPLSPISPSV